MSLLVQTFAVLVALCFVAPVVGTASAVPRTPAQDEPSALAAQGEPIGAPSLISSYLVGNGSALIFVGAYSWTDTWESESNGTQIYTNALTLLAFDLRSHNITLNVDAWLSGHGWVSNQSLVLTPQNETLITVPFPQDPSWRNAQVVLDNKVFYCQIATPVSLLPPSVLNVGGLDILALAIISEGIICFAGMVGLAKLLMRKARWARKFSLLVWGHVVVIGIAAAVVVDYEWVDRTFAGWSPLVYAFAASPMMLMSSFALFNSAKKAELIQRVAKPSGKILYRRWLLRYAVLPDGRTTLIDERWRGFLARLFGHYAIIDAGDEFSPLPFEGEVENRRSPTSSKGVTSVADRFRVTNPQEDDVERIWWTDTGDPVTVAWPYWTVHRMREARTKVSAEGQVLETIPAKRVLTWPHYVDAVVDLHRALEDYCAAEAVSAGWANVRDLARVLSKLKTDLYATKASFTRQVEAEVESRLVAYYSLLAKPNADLTDDEAKDLAQRGEPRPTLAELLDEARLRPARSAPKDEHGGKGKA